MSPTRDLIVILQVLAGVVGPVGTIGELRRAAYPHCHWCGLRIRHGNVCVSHADVEAKLRLHYEGWW